MASSIAQDAATVEASTEVCLICFEVCPMDASVEHHLSALSCGHGPFGMKCLTELFAKSFDGELRCPICRKVEMNEKPLMAVPLFFNVKHPRSRLKRKIAELQADILPLINEDCRLQTEVVKLKAEVRLLKKTIQQLRKSNICLQSSRDFWKQKYADSVDLVDEYVRLRASYSRLVVEKSRCERHASIESSRDYWKRRCATMKVLENKYRRLCEAFRRISPRGDLRLRLVRVGDEYRMVKRGQLSSIEVGGAS